MKKITIVFMSLALLASLTGAQAQEGKLKKKAAVAEAKTEVAADKAALKMNKEARQADKMSGNTESLKADRKAHMRAEGKLLKDQAKKDVKVVKEKL